MTLSITWWRRRHELLCAALHVITVLSLFESCYSIVELEWQNEMKIKKKKWFDWISVSRSHPSVQIWNVNPSNRKTPWLSASCCNKNIPYQICKERSNKRERKKNASGESRSNSKLIYGRWYIPICLKIAIKNPKNQHTFVITI